MNEDAGPVGVTLNALGEIVKLGKESPDAREAASYAAKSLAIVAKTVHTVLLPLAAANYGAAKFAEYMKERFGPELEEKMKDVPPDNIVPPRAMIAGPVLDALVYSHDEDELRTLYLSLLSSAMDNRSLSNAHPAFVDVLKQIDATEVNYLRAVLHETNLPIIQIRATKEDEGGYALMARHIMDWHEDGSQIDEALTAAFVDNWIRLGLITVEYGAYLTAPNAYKWAEARIEKAAVEATLLERGDARRVEIENGLVTVTNWGRLFAAAIRIDDTPSAGAPGPELPDWRLTT